MLFVGLLIHKFAKSIAVHAPSPRKKVELEAVPEVDNLDNATAAELFTSALTIAPSAIPAELTCVRDMIYGVEDLSAMSLAFQASLIL